MTRPKRHAIEMSNADDAIAGEVREIMAWDNFAKNYEVYTTPKIQGWTRRWRCAYAKKNVY